MLSELKLGQVFQLTVWLTMLLLVWKWTDLSWWKSSFNILWLFLSFKLDWSSYTVSITKLASKKIGTLICSMKFLSSKITPYLYTYTRWPCTDYWCHVCVGGPNCNFGILDKHGEYKLFLSFCMQENWL